MEERTDSMLARIRELVAGIVAVVLVTSFVAMIWLALGTDEPAFGRTKELIGILNTLVAVVVGYYFSRMTGEARAEKAEATVAQVTKTATDAIHAQATAASTVHGLATDGQQLMSALTRLRSAIPQPADVMRAAADDKSTPDLSRLQLALEEADRTVANVGRRFAH